MKPAHTSKAKLLADELRVLQEEERPISGGEDLAHLLALSSQDGTQGYRSCGWARSSDYRCLPVRGSRIGWLVFR